MEKDINKETEDYLNELDKQSNDKWLDDFNGGREGCSNEVPWEERYSAEDISELIKKAPSAKMVVIGVPNPNLLSLWGNPELFDKGRVVIIEPGEPNAELSDWIMDATLLEEQEKRFQSFAEPLLPKLEEVPYEKVSNEPFYKQFLGKKRRKLGKGKKK